MFITPSIKKSLIVEQFQGNYLNVKESQHATKRSLLVEKQKDFPTKNVLIRSLKTVWVGTAGVERSTGQNFVASKLKANFFVLLRVALLVLQA